MRYLARGTARPVWSSHTRWMREAFSVMTETTMGISMTVGGRTIVVRNITDATAATHKYTQVRKRILSISKGLKIVKFMKRTRIAWKPHDVCKCLRYQKPSNWADVSRQTFHKYLHQEKAKDATVAPLERYFKPIERGRHFALDETKHVLEPISLSK